MPSFVGITVKDQRDFQSKKNTILKYPALEKTELKVPEYGKREKYELPISKYHPEGKMTESEYNKFKEVAEKTMNKSMEYLIKGNKRDIEMLKKMEESKPTDPKELAKMNQLKKMLQNRIESLHNRAIDYAKRTIIAEAIKAKK